MAGLGAPDQPMRTIAPGESLVYIDSATARAAPGLDDLDVREVWSGQPQGGPRPVLQGGPADRRAGCHRLGQLLQWGDADCPRLGRGGERLQCGVVDEVQGDVGAALRAFARAVPTSASDAGCHREVAGQRLRHSVLLVSSQLRRTMPSTPN